MYGCTGWKRTLDKIKGCFLYPDTGGDAECTFRIFSVCAVFVSAIKKSFLSALSTFGWWGERTSIHKENKQTYQWLIKHRKCGIHCWLRCFWPWQNQFWCIRAAFCYLFNFPQVLTWHIIWNASETCAHKVLDGGWINPLSVICRANQSDSLLSTEQGRAAWGLLPVHRVTLDVRHHPMASWDVLMCLIKLPSKRIKSKIK